MVKLVIRDAITPIMRHRDGYGIIDSQEVWTTAHLNIQSVLYLLSAKHRYVLGHQRLPHFPRHQTRDKPLPVLTHWGRVTHICVSKLTIIGSDNGLSPGRRQAIIWTNVGILLIRTLGTNFSEILGEIHSFSISKMHLKMTSAKWRLFGLGLNELMMTTLS